MKIRRLPLRLVACMALGILVISCEKAKELVKVNVPLETAEIRFSIPEQQAGVQSFVEFNAILNIDSMIKAANANFGARNIRSLKLKNCNITASNSNAINHFGALSNCKASFHSINNSWVDLAELTNNPDAQAGSISLPVKDAELKTYFSGTSFSYKVSFTTRTATNAALNCKALLKFDAEVGP